MSFRVFITIFFSVFSIVALAQQDTLQFKKIDSTLNQTRRSIDKKLDKVDSAVNRFSTKLNSVSKLQLPDSLLDLNKFNLKLDAIKQNLTHRIDSLTALKLPTDRYKHLLDSLEKSGPIKHIKEAEKKMASLQTKVNAPVNKMNSTVSNWSNKINTPLADLKKEGVGVPGGINIPTAQSPSLNLPSGTLPSAGSSVQGLGGNAIPNASQLSTPGLPSANSSNPLSGIGEVKDVQQNLGQVSKVTEQTKSYTKEVKDISKGDLSKAKNISKEAEEQANKMEGVKELQKEKSVLEDYKKKAALGGNPEEMKKLATQEVRKEAINHFAGKEEVLKLAMGQLEKYKLKYPNASTIQDLTKRVRNEMYGKPLIERIVPAFSLQMLNKGDFIIDINPQVGYRLSGKWTAGLGWVERLQFHSINTLVPDGRIFGPRAFTDIKWKKGFGLRAEVEYINMYVDPSKSLEDPSRTWVWGVMAGIKKDYKIAKGVNGNIQILYKVDSPVFYENPYPDKINIRVGMEFPLKKKK